MNNPTRRLREIRQAIQFAFECMEHDDCDANTCPKCALNQAWIDLSALINAED